VTDAIEITRAIGKPGPRTWDDGSGVDGTGDETQVSLITPFAFNLAWVPFPREMVNQILSTRTYINHGSAMVG